MRIKQLLLAFFVFTVAFPLGAQEPCTCTRKVVDHKGMCMQTYMAMKAVQTAIEAYGSQHNVFPKASSLAELRPLIEPAYIARTPMTDAWGTEFKYVVAADGQSYKLISAGSDKTFAPESWGNPALLSSSTDDAVLSSDSRDREWAIQK
jgi:hypothetical protein